MYANHFALRAVVTDRHQALTIAAECEERGLGRGAMVETHFAGREIVDAHAGMTQRAERAAIRRKHHFKSDLGRDAHDFLAAGDLPDAHNLIGRAECHMPAIVREPERHIVRAIEAGLRDLPLADLLARGDIPETHHTASIDIAGGCKGLAARREYHVLERGLIQPRGAQSGDSAGRQRIAIPITAGIGCRLGIRGQGWRKHDQQCEKMGSTGRHGIPPQRGGGATSRPSIPR